MWTLEDTSTQKEDIVSTTETVDMVAQLLVNLKLPVILTDPMKLDGRLHLGFFIYLMKKKIHLIINQETTLVVEDIIMMMSYNYYIMES